MPNLKPFLKNPGKDRLRSIPKTMCPYPYSRSYRSDLINEELKSLLTWLVENKSSVFNSFSSCSHTRITSKSHSTGAERASGTMPVRA